MIKIVSWDAVGIRNEFFDCFHNSQADIFCVQDMQLEELQFMSFNPSGYYSYWNWQEKNKKSGTAVFTKLKPLSSAWGMGLCKVINPDYKEVSKKTLKGKTNDFKSCRTSTGTYLPFGETQEVRAFDSRVRNNYSEALSSMVVFVDQFIDTGKAVRKDATLVRALIDLISQDQSIDDSEEFFICEDGRAIKKAAIGSLQSVCLPAFLLGTWHYISVYRMDNTVGQETYDQWCPSHGNAPRPYKAHMGEGKYPDLKVHPAAISAQEEQDDEVVIKPELETEEQEQRTDTNTASAPGTTQIYNNPLIIQQNGNGNTVIPNYGTININKK